MSCPTASGSSVRREKTNARRKSSLWYFLCRIDGANRARRCCFQRRPAGRAENVAAESGSRRTFAGMLGVGQMASSVRREPRTASARFETRREVRGSSGSAGRAGVSPPRVSSERAKPSSVEICSRGCEGGSRETRDAPGDASDASVDVSVLGRSVTRAWRDDSVIFARPARARLRWSSRSRGARSRRGEEGLRAWPVASVLWTGGAARRGARRRATRRDGRTCAPARRGVCGREARADEGEGASERLREEEAQTSRNASILGTDDDTWIPLANRRE